MLLVGIEAQMVNMVNMRWHVSFLVLVLVGFETQVVNMVNMGGGAGLGARRVALRRLPCIPMFTKSNTTVLLINGIVQ